MSRVWHLPGTTGVGGIWLQQEYATGTAEQAEVWLRRSPYLALRNISCECRDGTLILRGCLPSYYLKQQAQAAVGRVEGVGPIANEIEVIAPPSRQA